MHQATSLLLVEDNPVSARFLAEVLRQLPAEVSVAGSVAEALAQVARQPAFSLWLLDANLPDGDGASLLQQLRLAHGTRTCAVCLTADAWPDRHRRLLEAGFQAVLVKPMSGPALCDAVREHLPGDAGGEAPTWDEAQALRAAGGNAGSVAALRALFADELPAQRRAVCAAFECGDVDALQAELHRLKASCGFVGAAGLLASVRGLSNQPDDRVRLDDFERACASILDGR